MLLAAWRAMLAIGGPSRPQFGRRFLAGVCSALILSMHAIDSTVFSSKPKTRFGGYDNAAAILALRIAGLDNLWLSDNYPHVDSR